MQRRLVKLKEIAEINSSVIRPSEAPSHIRYVDISSVGEGALTSPPQLLRFSEAPSRARRLVASGDSVLSTVRPNRRSMFQVSVDLADIVVSTGFAVISARSKICDPDYLYRVVFQQQFTDYLVANEKGAAYPAVTTDIIGSFQLELPSLEEQRRIAETLKALDDKIELNRRINETLEAMAQAIFRDWFVDFGPVRRKMEGATDPIKIMGDVVQQTDEAARLANLFPAAFADNGLPEGWEERPLADFAVLAGGAVNPAEIDPDTPYIGLEHMPRRSISLSEWEGASKVTSSKSRFGRGQILFGKLRPYFHKVGIAAIDGVCSTDIIVLDSKVTRHRSFVAACVSSDDFVAYADRNSTGTKMPRASWASMKKFSLPAPPPLLLDGYGEFVDSMIEKIICTTHENQTLAAMRDLLLPKLMSGEIRLKDAEKIAEAAE